jgi:hypothetical protein
MGHRREPSLSVDIDASMSAKPTTITPISFPLGIGELFFDICLVALIVS